MIIATTAGVVVAAPIVILLALAAVVPVLFAALWVLAWLVGLDGGTTGGGGD